jgi:hypothetical protein
VVPKASGATSDAFYLHASYRTWGALAVTATVADYNRGAAPAQYPVVLGLGRGSTIAWLGDGAPQSVTITVPPLNTVCIDRFEVSTLRDAVP